jgi:nitroimidazol reductase NimA-like FMN-containing flavoprotein (pyridoxamine 5'-phosphate oxidase superfamily)
MRRQDRKISESEAIEILDKGEFGILSMCTINNEGYGIPINYAFKNNTIYFHCAPEGSKLDYLRNNNKASFCVVGKTELLPSKFGTIYESVIAAGKISEIEGTEKQDALMFLVEKYSADFIEEGKEYINKLYDKVKVIKLDIESITGKARK